MTSEERREARYQRRVLKRNIKKARATQKANDFNEVFSYENLYASYKKCRKGVAWKSSVQKYITNAPLNVYNTHKDLVNGKYKSPGFYEFDLYERGKKRHIRSTNISERVVQKCLCENALIPTLNGTLIYDNGAAMKNKGYDFAVKRLTAHLQKHYRKYGNDGYILLFDFKKFFDNVSHEVIKKAVSNQITDEKILSLAYHFIDMFGDKGLGLGSQISQVLALVSANRLDHYIKEVLRIKYYGRYMDDGYLIHPSKEYLKRCLENIKIICAELGITLNTKKTQIVKLSHGFTWLKVRFFLTDKGKVIKKIYKRSVTRMRQKLKKLHRKWQEGKISIKDAEQTWQSWRAYAFKFNAYFTVKNMEKLFNNLFAKESTIYGIYQTASL